MSNLGMQSAIHCIQDNKYDDKIPPEAGCSDSDCHTKIKDELHQSEGPMTLKQL